MFQILVVEDDNELRRLFSKTLRKNSYDVTEAENAQKALDILEQFYPDLIITDVMMRGLDGFGFVKTLRESRIDIPVLIITAKGDIDDKEQGFSCGADDYMVKPINIREMLFRVTALLRRSGSTHERRLTFGNTELLYDSLTVRDKNGSQLLPQKEFQILYKLLSYPGRIFTRQQILDDIWGFDDVSDSHTLDVHISRLRERFKDNSDFRIVTIRGLGYKAEQNNG